MVKRCLFICLVLLLTACGTAVDHQDEAKSGDSGNSDIDIWEEAFDEELHFTDQVIRTYFLGTSDEYIDLNISQARADHAIHELGYDGVDSMLYTLKVEKTDDLEVVDKNNQELSIDDLNEGDKIYLEYDITDYEQGDNEFATDLLIHETVTKDEMVGRMAPPEGSDELYIGIISDPEERHDEFDFVELEFLIDYEAVRGFGDARHRDGVPAYDLIEAFEIEEELPVALVISEDGLEYYSSDLDEVVEFIENW
ncbi:hypothetical protein [Alkalibacillus aidingensis]|uniref:hypothetical protein n=1 Tax=Alkalibacillus aidingensis TaxID=2747607 RepID=UPI0016606CA1|nr:hypothetical protein [Alkalibacillus aidingensis]